MRLIPPPPNHFYWAPDEVFNQFTQESNYFSYDWTRLCQAIRAPADLNFTQLKDALDDYEDTI